MRNIHIHFSPPPRPSAPPVQSPHPLLLGNSLNKDDLGGSGCPMVQRCSESPLELRDSPARRTEHHVDAAFACHWRRWRTEKIRLQAPAKREIKFVLRFLAIFLSHRIPQCTSQSQRRLRADLRSKPAKALPEVLQTWIIQWNVRLSAMAMQPAHHLHAPGSSDHA